MAPKASRPPATAYASFHDVAATGSPVHLRPADAGRDVAVEFPDAELVSPVQENNGIQYAKFYLPSERETREIRDADFTAWTRY